MVRTDQLKEQDRSIIRFKYEVPGKVLSVLLVLKFVQEIKCLNLNIEIFTLDIRANQRDA